MLDLVPSSAENVNCRNVGYTSNRRRRMMGIPAWRIVVVDLFRIKYHIRTSACLSSPCLIVLLIFLMSLMSCSPSLYKEQVSVCALIRLHGWILTPGSTRTVSLPFDLVCVEVNSCSGQL